MTTICTVLAIARRTAYYRARVRPAERRYRRTDDDTVVQQIHTVTKSRATYGYRRVWAMVNRTFRTGYNRKRIRRVMPSRAHAGAPSASSSRAPSGTKKLLCREFLSLADERDQLVSAVHDLRQREEVGVAVIEQQARAGRDRDQAALGAREPDCRRRDRG